MKGRGGALGLGACFAAGTLWTLATGKATVRLQVAPRRDDIHRPLRCPDGRLLGGRSLGLAGRLGPATNCTTRV